jgi:GNAT superfamily N-acetyltransferase
VYASSDGAGGAVWIGPGVQPSLAETISAGALAMPVRLGVRPAIRAALIDLHLDRVRRESASARHWYLAALAVSPDRQRSGLGTALLKPILNRAEATGVPCYLETFRESTAAFYARAGFVEVRRGRIPGGGPIFWCMERPSTGGRPASRGDG